MPERMFLSLFARRALVCGCVAIAAPAVVFSQTNYIRTGVEYAIAGSLPQDQGQPQLGLSTSGGYLVWQDTITDGDGLGISALRLDNGFSGVLSSFRVNSIGAGDQENPQVSLLNGGGAVFVWQGGRQGFQGIYARFLSAGSLWLAGDLQVNTFTNNSKVNPVVTTLANNNVVVAWASFNQAASTSLQDVYAQLLSPTGQKIGGEFQVNQFISYNQRSPAIAALSDGRFVVVWVSEQQRTLDSPGDMQGVYGNLYGTASVDVYARIFTASGAPAGNEFLVSTNFNICSSPQVAAAAGGTFMVAWAERDRLGSTNGWDIWGRTYSSAGVGGPARCINTTRFGDQYVPHISWDGTDYMVVWTSLGQDGSREGVFGQFLHDDGSPDQGEFQVNTTWISQQMQPTVASDGQGRFLAAWTSFAGGAYGFDLYAQRYVNVSQPLPSMSAPFIHMPFIVVNNVYQPQIQVSWPVQAGLSVDHYDVYVGGTLAVSLTTNVWTMTVANGLTDSSTNSFQVDYVTTSGRRSPMSPAASGTTWTGQIYKNSLPVEWMAQYWGYGNQWPLPSDQVAPGGPTVLQVFLTGGDPTNPATWLRTAMTQTAQGYFLNWNPRPGLTYQVQTSTNLTSWANLGSPRLAIDVADSLYIGLNAGYYRVMWLH
jgi:hypothetical protein